MSLEISPLSFLARNEVLVVNEKSFDSDIIKKP